MGVCCYSVTVMENIERVLEDGLGLETKSEVQSTGILQVSQRQQVGRPEDCTCDWQRP